MNYSLAIQWYVNRIVDFQKEVNYKVEKEQIIITKWDIDDFPQPSVQQLENIYNEKYLEYINAKKFNQLRDERDYIFDHSKWIFERHDLEKLGISSGFVPPDTPTTLTDQQILDWVVYYGQLRNLPEYFNPNDWNLEDIVHTNLDLFGNPPTSYELTKGFDIIE